MIVPLRQRRRLDAGKRDLGGGAQDGSAVVVVGLVRLRGRARRVAPLSHLAGHPAGAALGGVGFRAHAHRRWSGKE